MERFDSQLIDGHHLPGIWPADKESPETSVGPACLVGIPDCPARPESDYGFLDVCCVTFLVALEDGLGELVGPEFRPPGAILLDSLGQVFDLSAGGPVVVVEGFIDAQVFVEGGLVIILQSCDNPLPSLDLETVLDEALLDILEEVHLPDLLNLSGVEVGQLVSLVGLGLGLTISVFIDAVVGLKLIDPLWCPKHDLPQVSEALASVVVVPGLPVETHGQLVLHHLQLVLGLVLRDNIVAEVLVVLAPEAIPPHGELSGDDVELCVVDTRLKVVIESCEGLAKFVRGFVLLALAQTGDPLIPNLNQFLIFDHALLQVLPHLKVEGGGDDAAVEVSDFVTLLLLELFSECLHLVPQICFFNSVV